MRRPIQIVLAIVILVLCASSIVFYQKYRKTSDDLAQTQTAEESARVHYGNAINAIATIQDSLNAIVLSDPTVGLKSNLNGEQRLTESQGDEVMARIAVVKAGIERTKERIANLDATLKKNNVKISGLQKMMANMKQSLSMKEDQVAMLTVQVDSLQNQVTGLTTQVQVHEETIQQQAQNIEEKRKELGTIYYAIGSKKALKDAGVIETKGGVLGMGKTVEPSGVVNEGAFTAIDTDQETVLRIPAGKAEVVSAQPQGSYQLQPISKTEMELHITNPIEFRKIKHLVIVTG